MLLHIEESLFNSPAQTWVHRVDMLGAMSDSIGQQIRRYYPALYHRYHELCRQDDMQPGTLLLHRTPHKWIVLIADRQHYRAEASLPILEAGLHRLAQEAATLGISSISMAVPDDAAYGVSRLNQAISEQINSVFSDIGQTVYLHYSHNIAVNPRALRSWLQGVPLPIAFDTLWQQIVTVVDRQAQWQHRRHATGYQIKASRPNRGQPGLRIFTDAAEPIFVSHTVLLDLCTYLQQPGYILADQLPFQIDELADYLWPLLAQLPSLAAVDVHRDAADSEVALRVSVSVQRLDDLPPVSVEAAPSRKP